MSRFADAIGIVCDMVLSVAGLLFCIALTIDMASRFSDIGAYRQIAIDCVRSL